MIPVQYRDAETEETLERRYEAEAPGIGDGVVVGVERCEVLYRWRCVPTSCIIYVRRLPKGAGAEGRVAA